MPVLQILALVTLASTAVAALTTAGRLLAHQWSLVARELDPTTLTAYPTFEFSE